MGGGNGAKAKQARERNAAKAKGSKSTSQLKSNAAAMTRQCDFCKKPMPGSQSPGDLMAHVQTHLAKNVATSFEKCFPGETPP